MAASPTHTHAKPDFGLLKEIGKEADALRAAGQWNRAAFNRLFVKATNAANGHDEFVEFLFLYAQPSWLK